MTQPADRPPYRPAVTVAVVAARRGKLLFVEERDGDRLVLNQPAGHVEAGETLEEAARRETLEETGWHVKITAAIGIYRWTTPAGTDYLRFAFAAEPLEYDAARAPDEGIERTLWLAPSELAAESGRLRSPLVQATLDDWCAGARVALTRLRDFP